MHTVRYLWQIKIVSPTSYLRFNSDKVPCLVEMMFGRRGNSAQCYSRPAADGKRPSRSCCMYVHTLLIYLHNVSLQMMPR